MNRQAWLQELSGINPLQNPNGYRHAMNCYRRACDRITRATAIIAQIRLLPKLPNTRVILRGRYANDGTFGWVLENLKAGKLPLGKTIRIGP